MTSTCPYCHADTKHWSDHVVFAHFPELEWACANPPDTDPILASLDAKMKNLNARLDDIEAKMHSSTSDAPDTDDASFGTGRVSVDFARRLERERDEARRIVTNTRCIDCVYWTRDQNADWNIPLKPPEQEARKGQCALLEHELELDLDTGWGGETLGVCTPPTFFCAFAVHRMHLNWGNPSQPTTAP